MISLRVPEPILVTPAETAVLLKISRSAVYALIRSHQLPSLKIGGLLRVPVAQLLEHVNREIVPQRSETAV